MSSAISIANIFSGTLEAENITTLFTTAYGKAPHVEVGFNKRRIEWEKFAPFIVLVPLSEDGTESETHREYSVGMTIGVVDKNSVKEAFTFLGESALPEILNEFADILPTLVESANIQNVATDYSQDEFPLMYLSSIITVTQPLYVGNRRR